MNKLEHWTMRSFKKTKQRRKIEPLLHMCHHLDAHRN